MPFLVTPPLPEMLVEIAFDSGFATPEGDRTWTDVSTMVEGALSASITYGRSDELATPDANGLTLTLDNRDGRFTPKKETLADGSPHPYFPNVKKGKPIRVTVRYAGVDYVRFTGYINEWPVTWPDGTDSECVVTLSARSRKARLGETAPLTSAIRAAYLESNPNAYWPMSEELQNPSGQHVFLDVTNTLVNNKPTQALAAFNTLPQPILLHDTPGPTDEGGLVKVPAFSDSLLLGSFAAYVGAGTAINVNSSGEFTVEVLARDIPTRSGVNIYGTHIFISSASQDQGIIVYLFGPWADTSTGTVNVEAVHRDPTTWAINDNPKWPPPGTYTPTEFAAGIDGELHHYALTVSGGDTMSLYFDGVLLGSVALTAPFTFDKRFTNIAFGVDTLRVNTWLGHAAVHDRALSGVEIAAHASAALAATETPEERVVRVAGRVGVPVNEVDVEDTIAADLGPQPEAGRSAAEVLDETATSTGGVLHDGRDGHLVMRARNSRYNVDTAFSLSGVLQEIQGDLEITDDHRYTINTVEFTVAGVEDAAPTTVTDQDSVDEYGVFSQTYSVVSSSPNEVEAFARDRLYRYADPDPRVSTVSVDLTNLDADQRARVLEADIDTRFGLVDLAGQAPTDPMHVFFEGAEETISATQHTMTINTTPGDIYQNVLILDDPVRGELDADNVLAY